MLRKNCNNLSVNNVISCANKGILPECCERCIVLTKTVLPVTSELDVHRGDIVVAKNNELYLIIKTTDTTTENIVDYVGEVIPIFVVAHLTDDITELKFNMKTTMLLDKFDSSLRKKMIVEFYNNDIITLQDITHVIARIRSESIIDNGLVPDNNIKLDNPFGLYMANRIIKTYFHENKMFSKMQGRITEPLSIN